MTCSPHPPLAATSDARVCASGAVDSSFILGAHVSVCLLDLQGLGGDYMSTSAGQRDRMLMATQKLEQSNDLLKYGKEQLAQTEVRRRHSLHCKLYGLGRRYGIPTYG